MQTQKQRQAGWKVKTAKKIVIPALAVVVVSVLLVFFAVPAFISSEKGRKVVLAKINNSVNIPSIAKKMHRRKSFRLRGKFLLGII